MAKIDHSAGEAVPATSTYAAPASQAHGGATAPRSSNERSAALFAEITSLACAVDAVLDTSIGLGRDDRDGWLRVAARALTAQMGWLADQGRKANGDCFQVGDADAWLLPNGGEQQ